MNFDKLSFFIEILQRWDGSNDISRKLKLTPKLTNLVVAVLQLLVAVFVQLDEVSTSRTDSRQAVASSIGWTLWKDRSSKRHWRGAFSGSSVWRDAA
jgi:hypothetical protein